MFYSENLCAKKDLSRFEQKHLAKILHLDRHFPTMFFAGFLYITNGSRIGSSTSLTKELSSKEDEEVCFLMHTCPMKCVFSTHFSEETSNIKSKKTSHTHEKKRSGARGNALVTKMTSPLIPQTVTLTLGVLTVMFNKAGCRSEVAQQNSW